MWVLVIVFGWPLVEIGLFVTLGAWLGFWLTMAVVILTAFFGVLLLRRRGAVIRGFGARLRDPLAVMADGSLLVFAGLLLILPGFFTDAIGLFLLLPPVRHAAIRLVKQRIGFATTVSGREDFAAGGADDVLEGDYSEVSDKPSPTLPPRGSARH